MADRPVLMRWVNAGHEIESETGHSIDLVSFLRNEVKAGHEIETDAGMQVFFADNTAERIQNTKELSHHSSGAV